MPRPLLSGTPFFLENTGDMSGFHDIAPLSGGGFSATWRQITGFGFTSVDIMAQNFSATGVPGASLSRTFTPSNLFSADLQPAVTGLSNGGSFVGWDNEGAGGDFDLFVQTLAAGSAQRLGDGGDQTDIALAGLPGNRIAVAWQQGGDVWAQIIDAAGNAVSTPEMANVFTSAAQQQADVAALPGGGFVVAWQSFNQIGQENEILMRLFGPGTDGALDSEIFVNRSTSGDQTGPQVAALENGEIVLVWTSEVNGNTNVRMARYSADGVLRGFEETVNQEPISGSADPDPQVTALAGGGFAVAWMEPASGQAKLLLQLYAADGQEMGDPFQVPATAGSTFLDEIRLIQLAGGDLVVSWRGDNPGSNSRDLFAQRVTLTDTGLMITGDDAVNDSLVGTAADDTIASLGGDDTIDAGFGDDLAYAGAGDDLLRGRAGNDTLYGAGGDDTLQGFEGDDLLGGGPGNDSFVGADGNDAIWTAAGNDTARGGNDNDTIGGALGDDDLDGGNGDDALWGAAGNDTLSGGNGDDTLGGAAGNDSLDGDDGNDELWGAAGNDTLAGGDGNDALGAGTENDVADGGAGDDTVSGGLGDDTLFGGTGDDLIFGAAGADEITGGAGNDTVWAGPGVDVVIFGAGDGADLVNVALADTLRLDDALWGGGLTEAQVLAQFGSTQGADYLLDFGGGDSMLLAGLGSATQGQLAGMLDIV